MITICKTVLSGAAPARIREQTEGLASGWLRDLAVKLAGDPALTVSVITHEDSTQELEVLRTGPPHHTERPSTAPGSPASPDGPCPLPNLPTSRTPSRWSAPSSWTTPLPEALRQQRPDRLPPLDPPVTAGPDVPQRPAQAGQHG